jgi:hypothetical protein
MDSETIKPTIDLNIIKKIIGVTLLLITLYYVLIATIITNGFSTFGIGYYALFFLPKILPITLMGFYLMFKTAKILRIMGYGFLVGASIALPFFVINHWLNIPMATYFQEYNWYYPPIIEWSGAFILCWLIAFYKVKDSFYSTLFSILTLVLGGFLYEITIGAGTILSTFYPFFVATPIICLFFIAFLLIESHWYPTKLFYLLLIPFIFYLVFYPFNLYFNIWIPRIPTIILLSTLPFGFKLRKEVIK